MKKISIIFLSLFVFTMVSVNAASPRREKGDIQARKQSVKENPSYKPGKEARWFKVLVRDSDSNRVDVKLTLPVGLIELFLRHAHDKHLRIHDDDYDVDFKELFQELKKLGPMSLIEIVDHGKLIKVWLE